jgi:hypothetical protein
MIEQSYIAVTKIRSEVWRFIDDHLVEAIGLALGSAIEERCAPSEEKINELEAAMSEFSYKGALIEGRTYAKGNFVTSGSVWHAVRDTTAKPGVNDDWLMVLARPRDGRDGRDAAQSNRRPSAE